MYDNTVVRFLDRISEEKGNDVAITMREAETTYVEYKDSARAIGTYLINIIKKINTPVAVYISKSALALETYMGILYSGNYYCPIPYESPIERAKMMLLTLEKFYLVTSREEVSTVEKWIGKMNNERIIFLEDIDKQIVDDKLIEKTLVKIIDCDPAYCLFTSGSTNVPKGVVVPHRAIIDRIGWMINRFSITSENVLGNQAPFHFDASMPDIFLNIIAGSRLVISPDTLFSFVPELLAYLKENNVNTLIWVPSALVSLTYKNAVKKHLLEKLRLVIFCGEVMHNKYLNIWREIYPKTIFVNMYGPTEAAYACTFYIVNREFKDSEPLPIGKPCGNTDIILMDEKGEKIEDYNESGEICVRGSSLALGYYNNKISETFSFDEYSNQYYNELYHTGDIGYWNEEEELMYVGRRDGQIKHMGYRIELGEIENAVLSLSRIEHACVLYDEDKDKIVVFFDSDDEECDRKYILNGLLDLIPKYMHPKIICKMKRLPFNLNGKIDRRKLNEYIREGIYEEYN